MTGDAGHVSVLRDGLIYTRRVASRKNLSERGMLDNLATRLYHVKHEHPIIEHPGVAFRESIRQHSYIKGSQHD